MGSGDSPAFSGVTGALGRPRPRAWGVWSEPVHASCRGGWFLVASLWCVCVNRETLVHPTNRFRARFLIACCSPTLGRCHQVGVGA